MRINIKTDNLKLTPDIEDCINKKIGGLEKFIPKFKKKSYSFEKGKPPYEVWMEIGRADFHHQKGKVFKAEIQINLPQKKLIASAFAEDLRQVITQVERELKQQLKKYKSQSHFLNRKHLSKNP